MTGILACVLRRWHDVGVGELTEYIAGLDEPACSLIERYRQRAMAVVPEVEV